VYDRNVRISTHDPNALYFDDFLKLGENLPRQSEVEKRWAEANDDDLCNILYTSGTTGDSKGVMLTYGQYHAALKANDECVPVGETDRVISFLPYTHIFERAWAYLALSTRKAVNAHCAQAYWAVRWVRSRERGCVAQLIRCHSHCFGRFILSLQSNQ